MSDPNSGTGLAGNALTDADVYEAMLDRDKGWALVA